MEPLKNQSSQIDAMREEFLQKGTEVMRSELEKEADFVVELQHENEELKNIDILSQNLIANKNLPAKIKAQVKDAGANLKKIIVATAKYIEERKFESIDQAIDEFTLSKYNKTRLSELLNAQKRVSFSFQTLNVVVELFTRVNENVLEQIKTQKNTNEQSRLLLKNAIIVYEIINFVADQIASFDLEGVGDITAIKEQVFRDIEENKAKDEQLKTTLDNVSVETKENILKSIENREEIRELVKRKWEDFDQVIRSIEQGVDQGKNFLPDLTALRDNARNHISVLELIEMTQVVRNNIEIIKNLAPIKKMVLYPLSPEDACNLLGISVKQTELPVNETTEENNTQA